MQLPRFDQRPAEFGAPISRIVARFRFDEIAFVQIVCCLVPVGFNPLFELMPRIA
jgi:hypothetical protein